MPDAQAGIFQRGGEHHHFLEYRVPGDADARALAEALARGLAPLRFPTPDVAAPASVVAFGPALWRRLLPRAAPASLHPYAALPATGGAPAAPATQRDLLLWVQGASRGAVFDRVHALHRALAPLAALELDVPGFVYHDSRDLSGFVDGSGNPEGEAARAAASIPSGPGAGGSFVVSQRWIHDLARIEAQPEAEQERWIGRTKPDSVEFEGDALAPDSHVGRVDVASAKIFRRSVPYGAAGEHGLYFLAFACDIARFEQLMARMWGRGDDGLRDRLFEFTRPVTGSFWLAPSQQDLAALLGG